MTLRSSLHISDERLLLSSAIAGMPSLTEKDSNLAFSWRLRALLESDGLRVVMTRLGRLAFLRATREHGRDIRALFLDVLAPDERRAIARASARVRERIRELQAEAAAAAG